MLLSAPLDVILGRVAVRGNNPFGHDPAQRRQIRSDLAVVEPLLRQAATHEIVTTVPLDDVVGRLEDIAREVGM